MLKREDEGRAEDEEEDLERFGLSRPRDDDSKVRRFVEYLEDEEVEVEERADG